MDWKLNLPGALMPPGDAIARGYTQCQAYMTSSRQMLLDISIISDLPRATLRRGTTASTMAHGMWWSSIVFAPQRRLYLELAESTHPRGNGFKLIWPPTPPCAPRPYSIARFTAPQVSTQLQRCRLSGRFSTTRAPTWWLTVMPTTTNVSPRKTLMAIWIRPRAFANSWLEREAKL